MTSRGRSRLPLVMALLLAWLGAHCQAPVANALAGDVCGAHDPSMIRTHGTWYVFTTGKAADGGQLGIRCSTDLQVWTACGHVFATMPAWITKRSPETKDLWAPDISFEHGEYRLYYAYSVFGKNTSGIALATNTTLDTASPQYQWKDAGLVLESKAADNFNAIDPNYFEDAEHRAWLDFGSFWSGIKMRALDPATGKLSRTNTTTFALASRGPTSWANGHAPGLPADTQAVEAPVVTARGGWYYLFVSFDLCCRGTKSTYRTMVGRARQPTGPYLDRDGTPMLLGGGTELLSANDFWVGAGGASVLSGTALVPEVEACPDLLVYHAYNRKTGVPALQISTIVWNDGWPQVALAR